MKGLDVLRWLMPAALAALLSVPVQTANARGMGGGGGHMGGMGGGHMGGRGPMGGIGGLRGHPAMAPHFFSRTGASRFGPPQNLAFRNHDFDRFAGRGDRFFDRRDQFRDSRGLPDRFADRTDRFADRFDRFAGRGDRFFDRRDQFRDSRGLPDRFADRTDRFADRGRFGNERFGREGRFEGREGERGEREFFFRHNFFVGFDFGAFGWWPWWGWGGPWWWDGGGWGYPYPYGDYGYYPYYGNPQGDGSQYNGSQYGAEYWNNLAMSVQTKLADQGYYQGQVDGVIGSGTIEAVRQFQADHGLRRTGKIDPKLLNALGINYKAQS